MDKIKLKQIGDFVLTKDYTNKSQSDDFAGVFLHSNSPVTLQDYQAPIHSFRAFSEYNYPIYFFISHDAITPDFETLISLYDNIRVVIIPTLTSIYHFNDFCINNLLYHIDAKHENLIYAQFDGFLLKPGYENQVFNYSFLGAKWKEDVKVVENTFNFGPIRVGNGGCGFRKRSKCLAVLDLVNKYGGQKDIVQGLAIDGVMRSHGSFLAEDAFFNYFGQGAGIFEPVDLDWIDTIAREPVLFEDAISKDLDKKPIFFHRVDE